MSGGRRLLSIDEIPVAHTPAGGWTSFPDPILEGYAEALPVGVPDLRGMWEVIEVTVGGEKDPTHAMLGSAQRIEQGDDRIVITGGGLIHDMRCDGTVANGVHDVSLDFTTEITVVATYEDGVHVLRPVGLPIEVRRYLEENIMVWEYGPAFTARLMKVSREQNS